MAYYFKGIRLRPSSEVKKSFVLNPKAKPFVLKDPIFNLPIWTNPQSGQKIMFLSTTKNAPVKF